MMKDIVIEAYEFAKLHHAGQKRKYVDLDYFSHPKWVARVLEDTGNVILVVVGLLHDLLEDTDVTYEMIEAKFGKQIADLCLELKNDKEKIKQLSKVIYMCQKVIALSYDACIVKLVDRIHNLLFAETDNAPYDFVKKYYKESIQLLGVFRLRADRDELMNKYVSMLETILKFYEIRYSGFVK